jgi:molecular chaperone DnaK (HSP70)
MRRDSIEEIVRYIGIDFGTSTSAVFFKDYYKNGERLEQLDKGDAEPVNFGRYPMVSTLVFIDAMDNAYFGEEAEVKAEEDPELLHSEFKMDLVKTEDPERVTRAETLTQAFLRHLYEKYRQQPTMQDVSVQEERPFISYPAKWPAPVRKTTVEVAKQAGFKNAEGMIEPEAAMRYFSAIRTSEYEELERRGVIAKSQPLSVLLIDMGAGTTDLVLYRYTPGGGEQLVLDSWPPVDVAERGANLSGREVDKLLFNRVIESALPEGWLDELGEEWIATFKTNIKKWKETVVSPTLRDSGCVDKLPADMNRQLRRDGYETPNIGLDRERFEGLFGDYLESFANLVDELVDHAKGLDHIEGGEAIDLVVLTGGHSQWYWVEDILASRLSRFERPTLHKIREEPVRILQGPNPQETVARGMAVSGTAVDVSGMPVDVIGAAANNAWLKIKLGDTFVESLQIQKIGDRLPFSKQIYRTVNYQFRSLDERMPGQCAVVAGQTLAEGKAFKPVPFAVLRDKSLFKRLFQYVAPEDKGEMYLKIDVDKDEQYAVLGLVQAPRSRGGYFAINRRAPNDSERRELFEAMQQHVRR